MKRLTERILSELRQETLPFNGYEQQASHLYKGMDLRYQSQLRTSQFRRVAEMLLTIPWLIPRVLQVHF